MAFEILKKGSFRFWGDWFGRPLDNTHKPVKCLLSQGLLTADFADGESLTVYNPVGVFSDRGKFYVKDCDKIIWEWNLYGEADSDDNRRFIEYTKLEDGRIKKISDLGSGNPEYFSPEAFNAVEMY